jgi:hypothetical protein
MRTGSAAVRKNLQTAQKMWADLREITLEALTELTQKHALSIALGDLILLDRKWYVTHSGLLRIASRSHCAGIQVRPVPGFSDPASARWAFKATVYRSRTCKGFVGYGDAAPCSVSPLMNGAEMRIAETRAVNRALRKAYGIGICSVEELGARSEAVGNNTHPQKRSPQSTNVNGLAGQPRLRDRLCQLIRQHRLEPALVKSYAIDFCRVATLKDAKREQVVAFVEHLSEWAAKDRDALLCQLNSYHSPQQGAA